MTTVERVSIGFSGGQVVEVRLSEDGLKEFRKNLEKAEGWSDLETEDGTVSVDLRQVVFIRSAATHGRIGFGQG
jgi:phosphosulfolactate synthase (CoM biosynthesis protein A)